MYHLIPTKIPTLSHLWGQWFELYIIPQNFKESTLNKHQNFGNHIKKFFGDTPLNLTYTGNRHTYASILISEGIDLWVLAKIISHKDITQIIETYGHLINEKEKKENNRIRLLLINNRSIECG